MNNGNGSNGNGSNGQREFVFYAKAQPVRKPVQPDYEDEDDGKDDDYYDGSLSFGPGAWEKHLVLPSLEQKKDWLDWVAKYYPKVDLAWTEKCMNQRIEKTRQLREKAYAMQEELDHPFRTIFRSIKVGFRPMHTPRNLSWKAKLYLVLGVPGFTMGFFMLAWQKVFPGDKTLGPCLALLLFFFLLYRFAVALYK